MNDLEKVLAVLKDAETDTKDRINEDSGFFPSEMAFLDGKLQEIRLCISHAKILLDQSSTQT